MRAMARNPSNVDHFVTRNLITLHHRGLIETLQVRGVLEIAQKAIEGCHCHMMESNDELAQNSNHPVFLIFLLEISITCQNSELAHFF